MRQSVPSDYPHEDSYGYSRAVRVGDHVFVSGTTARGEHLGGDAYEQTRSALAIVVDALAEVGAEVRHVVRTDAFVRAAADLPLVARAHHEVFGEVRPASVFVEVAGLIPAEACIEIAVTAVVD